MRSRLKPIDPRAACLLAWADAVIGHPGDYARIQTARRAFDAVAGDDRVIVRDLCGEYIGPVMTGALHGGRTIHAPREVLEVSAASPIAIEVHARGKRQPSLKVDFVAVGKRVQTAREQAGFKTQSAFAKDAKIPLGTVCTIESGLRSATEKTLVMFADRLRVSPRWLITGEGKPMTKGGAR